MRLLCLLGLLLIAVLPLHAGKTPPKIFLRVYVQTAGQGLPSTQAVMINIPPSNDSIQIRALPEVTELDLIDVQSDPAGAVRLQFNHHGMVMLDAATGTNQGRILVVTINGTAIYAPQIDEQITNGLLVLPHGLQPDVVQLLQHVAQENVRRAART